MPKIWFFGDSYTDIDTDRVSFRKKYDEYMGYKTKHFTDLIGESLSMDISVNGLGGVDNDTIIEKLIDNLEYIKPQDIIVINWTSITRFRLKTSDNEYPSYVLAGMNLKNPMVWSKNYGYVDINVECLEKILISRDSDIFLNQIFKWSKLLKHTFKNNKIIFWSPFNDFKNTEILTIISPPKDFQINYEKYKEMGVEFNKENNIENTLILCIDGHTKGGVKDLHFSEIGNHLVADLLLHELNKITI